MLSFKPDAASADDISRNWTAIEKQVDDALYEKFLPPQLWLWAGTGMVHAANNDRGDYLGFDPVQADNEAWTNMHVPPTWRDGSLGFEFLYTSTVAGKKNIDVELLANAVAVGESVDAGTDVSVTVSMPPPSGIALLASYKLETPRLAVNAGQHRLVTLRLKRIPSAHGGVWRFEGLIVRFGTGRREVHLA